MIKDEHKKRRIAFAGSLLDIEYQGAPAERVMAFLFRDLPQYEAMPGNEATAHFTYRFESDRIDGNLCLFAGDELERSCDSEADMALHLISQACYQLAYFSTGGLVMHAALLSRNGQGILLPGSTGKGKSSLAAWLLHRGYDYLTDELVYTPDDHSLQGWGLTRPLNLKRAARPLLREVFHISETEPGVMSNALVDLIPPEKFGSGKVLQSVGLERIIFPRFQPSASLEIRKLSKAQTGLELMQCLINARNLPEHGFPAVANLARAIPAYQMVYGGFEQVTGGLFASSKI